MEKRYYIRIVDEGFHKFHDAVTRMELIRRCNAILKPEFITEDRTIDILLNGESKQSEVDRLSVELSNNHAKLHGEEEQPIILSRAEPVLPWNERVVSFQVNPESATIQDVVKMAEELEDIIKMRDKPAKPTSKECEEWKYWTENMPTHSMLTEMQWEDQMKAWFLTMPIVPRAEKEPIHSPREEGQGVPK